MRGVHPAGKLDTLGIFPMVLGLVVYNLHHFSLETMLLSIKMFLIVFFVFLASPTATHSIVDAGMRADYRGYDTMFETAVVFCAGWACFLLLRDFRPKKDRYFRHVPSGVMLHFKNPDTRQFLHSLSIHPAINPM